MPAVRGRKHRTGVADAVDFKVRVSAQHRATAERAAAALGISMSAFIEQLLAREGEALDPDGRPSWWVDPSPRDQQELPFDKSA